MAEAWGDGGGWWEAQTFQISMFPVAAWPLGTNMDSGFPTRPLSSASTSVLNETMDFNTDPGCYRAMDQDMALGSNSGLDITQVLGGKQADNISLYLTPLFLWNFLLP